VLNGVRGIERLCRPLTGALEAVRHTAGARQHGWAAYLEERERVPRWQQEHSALSGPVSWGRSAKMDWVSEVLQFPVIIERGRVFSVEPQLL
jgi:hypothetical protein